MCALSLSLSEHGLSTPLLWSLQTQYFGQRGAITGHGTFFFSRTFLTAERSVARTVLLVSLQTRYVSNQRRRATRMRAEPKIVVCSTSLSNVKSGEHGRKDINLDLMVVMACHRFWM